MQNQTVTAALRQALAAAPETLGAESKERLRTHVVAFVDAVKAQGWPIERVIVAVKEVAAEAGVRSSTDVLRLSGAPANRDALLLDIVRWTVERYFGYKRTPARTTGDLERT